MTLQIVTLQKLYGTLSGVAAKPIVLRYRVSATCEGETYADRYNVPR
jgi:hypothetical protein